jgi:hypothetical protein
MTTFIKFKNFSSRLYSNVNLKFQKQFKFSSDKQYKEDRSVQSELNSIYKDINSLKQKLKNESSKVFFNTEAAGNLVDRASSVMKLQKQLKTLESKANETYNKLYGVEANVNSVDPDLRYQKEQIVRKSLIHDVFSSNYNHQNHHLNPLSYINRYTFFESRDDKMLLREANILEEALGKEIKDFVNNTIAQEIGGKSIDEITLTDRQYLKDSDTKINYDPGVENTRLFQTTNLDDDFSTAFSEEKQLKQKISREEPNSPFLNNTPDLEFNRDNTLINKIASKTK